MLKNKNAERFTRETEFTSYKFDREIWACLNEETIGIHTYFRMSDELIVDSDKNEKATYYSYIVVDEATSPTLKVFFVTDPIIKMIYE